MQRSSGSNFDDHEQSYEPYLDREAFAPTILITGKLARFQVDSRVPVRIEYAREPLRLLLGYSNIHSRIRENVLNPLGLTSVLRQDVQPAIRFNVPDFNFARPTCLAAGSGQV